MAWSKDFAESEWAEFESNTFRFRDPNNKGRRKFVLVRLDEADVNESLAQFLYLDWRKRCDAELKKLVLLCRTGGPAKTSDVVDSGDQNPANPNLQSCPRCHTENPIKCATCKECFACIGESKSWWRKQLFGGGYLCRTCSSDGATTGMG